MSNGVAGIRLNEALKSGLLSVLLRRLESSRLLSTRSVNVPGGGEEGGLGSGVWAKGLLGATSIGVDGGVLSGVTTLSVIYKPAKYID